MGGVGLEELPQLVVAIPTVVPIIPKLAIDVTFLNVFFLFMFTPMIKYK
jgi:hypothetical protein